MSVFGPGPGASSGVSPQSRKDKDIVMNRNSTDPSAADLSSRAAPPANNTPGSTNFDKRQATIFVVLLGVVSLFSDMTYESARSIAGPILAVLGASATAVGVVAGLGELIGYALRLVSGRLADRTGNYWSITFFGYALNLLAVPLLALAGNWQVAVALMFLERAGKAMRSPPRDAMLSFAGHHTGQGWGFALHEAMDQTGATVGPLITAGILHFRHDYKLAFACLAIPAALALTALVTARLLFPRPRDLAPASAALDTQGFDPRFWWYLGAAGCIAAGFADYPLIAFHFEKTGLVPGEWIAVFYAVAMGVDGLAALVFGYLYDRRGMPVLIAAALLPLPVAPLVFFGGFDAALVGAVLWGVGMGAQESILKAVVAALSPAQRRGTAFGIYNLGFGVFWFLGSALMGVLYDRSLPWLVAFSVVVQFAAVPLLIRTFTGRSAS